MIYINSVDGKCYHSEDFDIITTFLASCFGFELITAPQALEIINRFDRVL